MAYKKGSPLSMAAVLRRRWGWPALLRGSPLPLQADTVGHLAALGKRRPRLTIKMLFDVVVRLVPVHHIHPDGIRR